jgi:hypothetical protein
VIVGVEGLLSSVFTAMLLLPLLSATTSFDGSGLHENTSETLADRPLVAARAGAPCASQGGRPRLARLDEAGQPIADVAQTVVLWRLEVALSPLPLAISIVDTMDCSATRDVSRFDVQFPVTE